MVIWSNYVAITFIHETKNICEILSKHYIKCSLFEHRQTISIYLESYERKTVGFGPRKIYIQILPPGTMYMVLGNSTTLSFSFLISNDI